jgi:hypothetical protein
MINPTERVQLGAPFVLDGKDYDHAIMWVTALRKFQYIPEVDYIRWSDVHNDKEEGFCAWISCKEQE